MEILGGHKFESSRHFTHQKHKGAIVAKKNPSVLGTTKAHQQISVQKRSLQVPWSTAGWGSTATPLFHCCAAVGETSPWSASGGESGLRQGRGELSLCCVSAARQKHSKEQPWIHWLNSYQFQMCLYLYFPVSLCWVELTYIAYHIGFNY